MDKRKKKTRRVLIGRKKTIKKIRRQNSERKLISTQQNLEETKAATDFIFTQRQHKTSQKIVPSKYGIYEPKEESRAFSPQPRLMHLTCLPLQYNLKTIREHPMQPLSDHNNHWLEREVGLVHNSDKVYYSRRNCYIPNEWMMDHNNETEEMLKLNLNNYHKRPILKQRDIWSYVDYDLEAALPEISPVQEALSTEGFIKADKQEQTRSYGVKSLQEVGTLSGGGPHMIKLTENGSTIKA